MEAPGHVGCLCDDVEADGAQAVCRCLSWRVLLQLAAAAPRSRAALLQAFLSTRRHVLPREPCRVAACSLRYQWESKESPRTRWERGGKGFPGGSWWAEKQRWQPLVQPWAKGPGQGEHVRLVVERLQLGLGRSWGRAGTSGWGRMGCASAPCWMCEAEEEEEQEGKP